MIERRGFYKLFPVRLLVRAVALLFLVWGLVSVITYITNGSGLAVSLIIGASLFSMSVLAVDNIYVRMGWEKRKEKVDRFMEMMSLTPYEFEHSVAGLMKKMGYSTEVTAKSEGNRGGDFGADIIAEKDGTRFVVQVKQWAPNSFVGANDVRSTLGCMHTFKASKAILITTSDFTRRAYDQARGAPIELWNKAKLKRILEEYA